MIEEKSHRCTADSISRRSAIRTMAMGSVAFFALAGLPGTANAFAQEGWRWCRKCQIMFFAQDRAGGFGVCPAGGRHDPSASDYYYLRMEPEIAGVQQGGWSWCMKCMGLYGSVGANMGACPAGGSHNNFSGAYAAVLGEEGPGQQGGWRWCRKCMGMFYGRAGGGVCPADRSPHDGSPSLHYAHLT